MKTIRTKFRIMSAIVAVAVTGLSAAHATLVTYSVSGDLLTIGGDLVTVDPNHNSQVDLTPNSGTPVTSLLNTVNWNLSALRGSGDYTGTIDRSMTINLAVGSQTLSQDVSVQITRRIIGNVDNQVLTIEQSSPVFFHWSAGGTDYQLQVTALGLEIDHNGHITDILPSECGRLDGEFLLTETSVCAPVPEPSTFIAGALVLLPFAASAYRTVRKNRA